MVPAQTNHIRRGGDPRKKSHYDPKVNSLSHGIDQTCTAGGGGGGGGGGRGGGIHFWNVLMRKAIPDVRRYYPYTLAFLCQPVDE